jgi:hypothetical protein
MNTPAHFKRLCIDRFNERGEIASKDTDLREVARKRYEAVKGDVCERLVSGSEDNTL